MELTTAPQDGGSVTIADNPALWLEQKLATRDAEPTSDPGQGDQQASPAEPTVAPSGAETQPAVSPLDVTLPEDFEHGFFRGKKVAELYKSYKEAETAKQRAERERNELREAAERLRADLAARDLALKMAAEQRQAQADPYAEIEQLWFENPRAAAAKLRESTLAEVKQQIAQETHSVRQDTAAEARKRELLEAGGRAYDQARETLKVSPEVWNKRAKAVLVELTDPGSTYYANGGPLVTENYVQAYRELFGEAEPVVVKPAPAPVSNPPGSTRPAVTQAAPNAGLPTMSSEKRAAYTMVANSLGIDPDAYIKRILGGASA